MLQGEIWFVVGVVKTVNITALNCLWVTLCAHDGIDLKYEVGN